MKSFSIGGFKALRKSSELLYKAFNNNPELSEVPELTPDLMELAREYLPALAEELEQGRDAAEVARDYVNLFEVVGAATFRRMLEEMPEGVSSALFGDSAFCAALERAEGVPLLGAIAS